MTVGEVIRACVRNGGPKVGHTKDRKKFCLACGYRSELHPPPIKPLEIVKGAES